MRRWTYLIPRLIIIAMIGLAVWLSADSLLRRALIANAEAVTGAKVEVGQLRLNLDEGKVFLEELQFADPRNTDLNLFQADMAYLDVDLTSLLRRKIKITGGRTSDLRFGSPRTSSGQLPAGSAATAPTPLQTDSDSPLLASPQVDQRETEFELSEPESRWLDSLQEQIVTNDSPKLQSSEAVQTLAADWAPRLAEAKQNVQQINEQIERLKESFGKQDSNPLRQDFDDASSQLKTLLKQMSTFRNKLEAMRSQADADKVKLTAAQRADRLAIEQLASIQSFDGETITQLLLARSQRERVDEIIRWFRWFRNSVPDFERDFRPLPGRGVNVAIPPLDGKTVQPDFLVEDLEIEGAGHFAGQFLNFAGKLKHLSSQPKFHTEPTSFDLRAQGKNHFVVNCELDRRNGSPTDTLEVRCPDLQIVQSPLGSNRSVLITVGPNIKLQADVRLKAIGESLAGDLVFRHSNVSLHVDQLHSLAGGTEMALRLNQELSACDQFETRISLSGTMSDYTMNLESDLGARFAQSMNEVSSDIQRQRVATQQQRLKSTTERQIVDLTGQIDQALRTLDTDAVAATQWLKQTQQNISSTAKAAWPSIR